MLQLTRNRHEIVDLSLGAWLKREFPKRPLFVYRHRAEGTFVVAEWVNKDRGVAYEFMVIGRHPGEFTREKAAALKIMLGVHAAENRQALQRALHESEYQEFVAAEEEQHEFQEEHRAIRHALKHNRVKRDHPLLAAACSD